MVNYQALWNKVFNDLDNDDIVLEIKILETNIQDWKKILILLKEEFGNRINYNNTSFDLKKINNLNINNFPDSENDITEYLVLDFKYFRLTLTLYTLEEIEFFSDSIIKLKIDEVNPLFLFCEAISSTLSKNVYIYCEGYKQYSLCYNSEFKLWTE